jgi:hypothetical protein
MTSNKIDYSKLLGFEAVEALITGGVDFQDDALAAKLGAKVGAVDPITPGSPTEAPKE